MQKKIWAMMFRVFNQIHHQEDGQSMIEYGLIIALIAVVVVVALTLLGTNVSSLFTKLASSL